MGLRQGRTRRSDAEREGAIEQVGGWTEIVTKGAPKRGTAMEKEMSNLAKGIAAGMKSALAHAKGRPQKGTLEHVVMMPDVKAIREALGMSQNEFANAYNIPLPTLKGWEQGRRRLDTTAIAYLRTIARFPKQARRAQLGGFKAAAHSEKRGIPIPA